MVLRLFLLVCLLVMMKMPPLLVFAGLLESGFLSDGISTFVRPFDGLLLKDRRHVFEGAITVALGRF